MISLPKREVIFGCLIGAICMILWYSYFNPNTNNDAILHCEEQLKALLDEKTEQQKDR
jgi:hypothetical protein